MSKWAEIGGSSARGTAQAPVPTPSFTIEDSLSIGKHNHAPLVATLYSHSSRGSGRCRSRKPQAPGPRWIHPSTGRWHLLLPVPRQSHDPKDHGHRPPGNGQDRAGVLPAHAASARSVGGERTLDRDGRQHVSP